MAAGHIWYVRIYIYVCRIYSLACYLASSSRRNPLRYVAFDELNPKWPMGQQKNQKQKIHNTKYKITAAAPAIQCRKPSKQASYINWQTKPAIQTKKPAIHRSSVLETDQTELEMPANPSW